MMMKRVKYLTSSTLVSLRGETHELRVHQMFTNEDGWPVTAVHRYTGETIGAVARDNVVGSYQFVNHGKDVSGVIKPTVDIELK